MIQIAAGILLAVVILLFFGSIVRAFTWVAIGLVVIVVCVVLLVIVPGELSAGIVFALILGPCIVALLTYLNRPSKPSPAPDQVAGRNDNRDQMWLGDGQRIVTKAFGPFVEGQSINHWQADYTRVFVEDLAFAPREVMDNSRPIDRT